jgi:membrane-associated phospholipid phosphatase
MLRVVVAAIVLASTPAYAEPSERSDGDRVWNIAPFAVGGAVYLLLEFGLKEKISRTECWWCATNGLDVGARNTFKWDNIERADAISNVTGYVLAPTVAIGGLLSTTLFDDGNELRRTFDDVVPVLQAGIVAGVFNQAFKIAFGRKRPYAHFKGRSTQKRKGDVNTSFFSGHSALAFSMATSAGTVASLRGYDSAPMLWGGGLALAATTAYLRIAADAHYATDVLGGAVIGSLLGVAIPLLFHRKVLTDEPAMATPRETSGAPVIFSIGRAF